MLDFSYNRKSFPFVATFTRSGATLLFVAVLTGLVERVFQRHHLALGFLSMTRCTGHLIGIGFHFMMTSQALTTSPFQMGLVVKGNVAHHLRLQHHLFGHCLLGVDPGAVNTGHQQNSGNSKEQMS